MLGEVTVLAVVGVDGGICSLGEVSSGPLVADRTINLVQFLSTCQSLHWCLL